LVENQFLLSAWVELVLMCCFHSGYDLRALFVVTLAESSI